MFHKSINVINGEMLAYFHGNRLPNPLNFLKIGRCFLFIPVVIGAFFLSFHVSHRVLRSLLFALRSLLTALRSHTNFPRAKDKATLRMKEPEQEREIQ